MTFLTDQKWMRSACSSACLRVAVVPTEFDEQIDEKTIIASAFGLSEKNGHPANTQRCQIEPKGSQGTSDQLEPWLKSTNYKARSLGLKSK